MPPLVLNRILKALPGPAGREFVHLMLAYDLSKVGDWLPQRLDDNDRLAVENLYGSVNAGVYAAVDLRMSWLTGSLSPDELSSVDALLIHELTSGTFVQQRNTFFHYMPYFVRMWLLQDSETYTIGTDERHKADRLNAVLNELGCGFEFKAAEWVAGLAQTYTPKRKDPTLFYRFMRVARSSPKSGAPVARIGIGPLFLDADISHAVWEGADEANRGILQPIIRDEVYFGRAGPDILKQCLLTEPCTSYQNRPRGHLARQPGTSSLSGQETRQLPGRFPLRPCRPLAERGWGTGLENS